jgi:flagellar biogenesis protein FliO
MIRKIAIVIMMALVALSSNAGVKVTSLDLKTNGANGYISVSIDGRSNELPDIKVYGKTIELSLNGAEAFEAISKNIRGAYLSANVLNGKAIVKATLPYAVRAEGVDLGWKNKNIEIIFPRGTVAHAEVQTDRPVSGGAVETPKTEFRPENKVLTKVENTTPKEALNEEYLKKLMNEEKAINEKTTRRETDAPPVEIKNDEVKIKQSSIQKTETVIPTNKAEGNVKNNSFSFAGYAAKFGVFLALVLGLFYGVVQLLKKGVFNRGKLGFLNNAQMIQVLSTTYVAPKRSLMVVKAHKQIFLVSNSENGIQFLSEMTDTSGLIKEGEKFVTGTNFDLNLGNAETTTNEIAFKIKEDINESTPIPEEKGIQGLSAKDIVKFSDELKKKAKKLKPIEFN